MQTAFRLTQKVNGSTKPSNGSSVKIRVHLWPDMVSILDQHANSVRCDSTGKLARRLSW